jgi:transcriptional regulator with PAS, ATPase and Fis domain
MVFQSIPGETGDGKDSEIREGSITHFDFEMVLNAYAVVINLQSLLKETEKYIYTADKSSVQIVLEKRKGYLDALDKLEELDTKEESRKIISSMRVFLSEGREANFKVLDAVEKGDIKTAMSLFTAIVDPTVHKVQGLIPEFVKRARVQSLVSELVDRATEISHFDFEKVLHANAVVINLQALLKETARIMYTKDTSSVPLVLEHRAKYQDAVDKLGKLATDLEEREIINEIASRLTIGRMANNQLFDAIVSGRLDKAMSLFTTIVDPTIDEVQRMVTELIKRALPLKSRATQPEKILSESIFTVLDSLHEGVMVLDADSTITYLNPAFTNLMNITKERIVLKKLSDIEPQAEALKALKTKQSITGGYDIFRTVGKHFLFDANCIMRSDEVVGLVVIVRDISDLINLDRIFKQYDKPIGAPELTKDKLPDAFRSIIGSSPNFVKTLWFASQVSPTEAPVLLEGESGVGKELFAWAIHESSLRAKKPMITVNCGAIPDSLYESELFGYEEGAFTGAKKSGKPGKFELASGGTLFLDEIGEMPLSMQSKLLRVLQEGKIDHLGGIRQIPVDARIIAATNKNLSELIKEKLFRQDLFYRLNVINVRIPPLRDRIEDIPELVKEIIKGHNSDITLSVQVLEAFYNYPWLGNVRELKNVIYHTIILRQKGEIVLEDLPGYFLDSIKLGDGANLAVSENQYLPSSELCVPTPPLKGFVADMEKDKILRTLNECNGNRTRAMQILGICRRTFYKKLKKYEIE